jgi:hypothetical protein
MSEAPDEKDEAQRALEELYKDGRKPTLQELLDFSKKFELKLVSVKFPSDEEKKPEEKP